MPIDCPETEILLCCARTRKTTETGDRIRALLQEDIDWDYLLATARRHRVAPLLYWHLKAVCPDAVPERVLAHLRNHFRVNSARNLFLTGELRRLLDTFESHGIGAIAYKGPALAALAYDNLALRQFGDLDIMVHQHDVSRAEELLVSLGYRPHYQLTRAQKAAFLQHQSNYLFEHADGRRFIELHWRLTESYLSFTLDIERLWARLQWVSLGGGGVWTFSPEDMLMILCVHGAKHLWHRLAWVCDIAELIRVHPDIGWERVMAQAAALRGERMLLLGLFLASDLLGATLPQKVWQQVHADPTVKVIARRITERLFLEEDGQIGLLEEADLNPLYAKMRESLPDKVHYYVRRATGQTVEDWNVLPLPRFLFFFYYAVRFIRLTRRYGLRLLGRPA